MTGNANEPRENEYRPPGEAPPDPVHFRRWEFFITVEGPAVDPDSPGSPPEPYPLETDEPNVYYCNRLKNVTFPKEPGQVALAYEKVDDEFEFVFNMVDGEYIEEGTVILAFPAGDGWFTFDKISGDLPMFSYCWGSQVVVVNTIDGRIIFEDVVTHPEFYPQHTTESEWHDFEAAFQTNPISDELDGFSYLRVFDTAFDQYGNLYAVYSVFTFSVTSETEDSSIGFGIRIMSGVVRFDYSFKKQSFEFSWRKDVCERWTRSLKSFFDETGMKNIGGLPKLITDSSGNVFATVAGWPIGSEDEFRELEIEIVNTNEKLIDHESGYGYAVRLEADSGEILTRYNLRDHGKRPTLNAQQSDPDTMNVNGIDESDQHLLTWLPGEINAIHAPNNGRIYFGSTSIKNQTNNRRRLGSAGIEQGKILVPRPWVALDYDGNWRDNCGHGQIGFQANIVGRAVFGISHYWQFDATVEKYRLFFGLAIDSTFQFDACTSTVFGCCGLSDVTDGFVGLNHRTGLLVKQLDETGSELTGLLPFVVDSLGTGDPSDPQFGYHNSACRWIRGGTFGSSNVGLLKHEGRTNSVDIVGERMVTSSSIGWSSDEPLDGKQLEDYVVWDKSLFFQAIPRGSQPFSFSLVGVVGSGFDSRQENGIKPETFWSLSLIDTNDDPAFSWIATYPTDRAGDPDPNPFVELQNHRIYKADDAGNILWRQLEAASAGDILAEPLPGVGGPIYFPGPGAGPGGGIDHYNPKENPDGPQYRQDYVGKRFKPPAGEFWLSPADKPGT